VRDVAIKDVVSINAADSLAQVRSWLAHGGGAASHQGFPVLNERGELIGVITRRDITDTRIADTELAGRLIRRPPAIVYADNTLREAADHMVREGVGRLPVVLREQPRSVIGIVSRSDLLAAHDRRLQAADSIDEGMMARFRR